MKLPQNTKFVLNTLTGEGHEAFLCGGAVRDKLMGVEPKDFDVATSALPEAVMATFRALGHTVLETGLKHGTVTVMVNGEPMEVTTFRVDVETDGRHAEVQFVSDSKLDAARRDLTFNSMFMDVDGNVVDHFNGREDLDNRVTRFVGNADDRLKEDFLRVLRFFRFAGRMGNVPNDTVTREALKENASGLEQVSGERVWAEMSKMLTGDNVAEVFEAMQSLGVLHHAGLPEWFNVEALRGVSVDNPVTMLSVGLVGHANTMVVAEMVADRWKFSNKEKSLLMFLTNDDHQLWVDDDVSDCEDMLDLFKMMSFQDTKEHVVELCRLNRCVEVLPELEAWEVPVLPVAGKDLLEAGMKAGKGMGERLNHLELVWMASMFTMTKDELMELS